MEWNIHQIKAITLTNLGTIRLCSVFLPSVYRRQGVQHVLELQVSLEGFLFVKRQITNLANIDWQVFLVAISELVSTETGSCEISFTAHLADEGGLLTVSLHHMPAVQIFA